MPRPAVYNLQNGRSQSLDILRGIAILLVVFSHTRLINPQLITSTAGTYLLIFFNKIQLGGWTGVDLFFVLSGFLVSGLLFKEFRTTGSINTGKFLIRRGFRIYPAFIFFIVSSFVIDRILGGGQLARVSDYIKDLLFLHNYFGGRWGITWSLDVEEAFYFLLAAFFFFAIKYHKLKLRVMLMTSALLVIVGIYGRWMANLNTPFSFAAQYSLTHFRLDALFAGVLISYVYHYHQVRFLNFFRRYKLLIIVSSLVCLLPNFLLDRENNRYLSIFFLSLNPLAYGCIMACALTITSTSFCANMLAFIGRYSYAIYLWHTLVNEYLRNRFHPQNSLTDLFLYILAFYGITLIISIVTTLLIEKHFLKLRERYFPSKVNPAAA